MNPHADMLCQINRLRRIGWSDASIARHLSLPLLTVRDVLGLPTYTRDGLAVVPLLRISSASEALPLAPKPEQRPPLSRAAVAPHPVTGRDHPAPRKSSKFRIDAGRASDMRRIGLSFGRIAQLLHATPIGVKKAIERHEAASLEAAG